jgi:SAM-dependent methyltransferase
MKCRHCSSELKVPFVDLGSAPPSNAYVPRDRLDAAESWYPLRVMVCTKCWLAQTEDFARPDQLFDAEYAYFSSYSSTWVEHARNYVEAITSRLALGPNSHVVELAANDGYLLQFFKQRGIPSTGIEPTASTAAVARSKGLSIIEEFFGVGLASRLAAEQRSADLIVANNVLAHVPDINDFVGGVSVLLKHSGVATFEFPHLLQLVTNRQFDTVYHEHYSYLSLTALTSVFDRHQLEVFDVDELPSHGGSLRLYVQRKGASSPRSIRVDALLTREASAGMTTASWYEGFNGAAEAVKCEFLEFLLGARKLEMRVGAYGAAAKGNTLLNWCGIRADLVPWVVDRNPAKIGKFLPGSRIPIVEEAQIRAEKPDFVVILPWNLSSEISDQLSYIRQWRGKFVTAIPTLRIW